MTMNPEPYSKDIPLNALTPRGGAVQIYVFVDANHARY
jgi:hypothetical protein